MTNDSSTGTQVYVIKTPDRKALREFGERIVQLCKAAGFPEKDLFAIRLCYEEAVTNALIHGNKRDPNKAVTVTVELQPDQVRLRVEDEGPGFDPSLVPDPTAPENLARPSGRGLLLMRHYMDLRVHPPGNIVELVRVRSHNQ